MRPTLKAAVALGAVLLLAPLASAQVQNAQLGGFGTLAKVGDVDYVPMIKRSGAEIRVMVWEAEGKRETTDDNCVLLIGDSLQTYEALPRIKSIGSTFQPREKDIRLTPCLGKGAGTAITGQERREMGAKYVERAVEVRYVDVDENGRYGKGDYVYLGTKVGPQTQAAADLAGDAGTLGLDATQMTGTAATGKFTIRLTPAGDKPAGSFVRSSDADFDTYGARAAGAFRPQTTPPAPHAAFKYDNPPQSKKWSLIEREGGGWYFAPEGVGSAAVAKGMNVPVNSVRIGLFGTANLQPNVIVTAVELANAEAAEAGKPLPVIITVANTGTAAGQGVIVTRLDHQILDVRMSAMLGPGETTKTIVTVPAVPHGGAQELEVNDAFLPITVQGDAAGTAVSSSSVDVAALQAQLTAVQGRLATLEAGESAPVARSSLPGVMPLAVLGILVALGMALRRRAA